MIAIRTNELPSEFHESAYYKSFEPVSGDEDASTVIMVPDDCVRTDMTIMCDYDLHHMLRTAMFWGFETATTDMLVYCLRWVLQPPDGKQMQTVLECADHVPNAHLSPIYWELLAVANPSNVENVVRAGLPVLRFFEAVCCSYYNPEHYVKEAIRQNKVDCLRHLLAKRDKTNNVHNATFIEHAVSHGHMDSLVFLHKEGYSWRPLAAQTATKGNHRDCLAYLIAHGPPLNSMVTHTIARTAVTFGSFACLDYLLDTVVDTDHWFVSDLWTYVKSAYGVHYLANKRCPWHIDAMTMVILAVKETECVSVVEYCHRRGCSLSTRAIAAAVHREHYDCVVYLVDNGCPWNEYCYKEEFTDTRAKCYAYLAAHGRPKKIQ